ncbi:hypothetical protein LTR78_001308 [Recurvomyces mirabilis]|uniref:Rhodopsin domain-containing protein n=1 Tax=Recurvomyces mirabilis TaxID=574656 RepID=A0AAE1C5J4_9PEZI|nr:hypothetical protein LTR78_001308 [Recurvomyces mirabilis]KAK5161285.1 hypothetical protein LTS14_001081 [Recurvomyces mirabilis]
MDNGFKKATSTDHRGWLWVTVILSIIYTVSILLVRLFGKYGLLSYDDATLGLAYCIAAVRWGVQMHAISDGLGAELAVVIFVQRTAKFAFAARVLLMICLYLSKLSIVVFIRKVFSGTMNHENIIFAGAYTAITMFGIASVFAVAIDCRPSRFLSTQHSFGCPESAARSIVLCILDVFSELLIIFIPVVLLSKLQMQQSKKRAVYSVFALRIA